jgi:hypothetical protein
MVMAVATMHDDGYSYLSPLTWEQNGLVYCETWGYPYIIINEFEGKDPGFAKIDNILTTFKENPEVEWMFYKDCDSLITNFNIRIEEIVDNDYHILLNKDFNDFNTGMMMVRNSPQACEWMRMILDRSPEYAEDKWKEQQLIIDTYEQYTDIIKVVPQRTFNAYCFSDGCHLENVTRKDVLGNSGQWELGDFAMHWPGQGTTRRVHLAQKYLQQITPADPEKVKKYRYNLEQ